MIKEKKIVKTNDSSKESIPDIQDIMPRNDDRFKLPLIRDFLKDQNPRDAILQSCEIINGSYGETAVVYFDGNETGFRCTSGTFIDQVKQLIEMKTFPLKVHIAKIQSNKTGHPYFILNATDDFDEEENKKDP